MADNICSDAVVDTLKEAGFSLFAGVPCSYLTPLIDTLSAAPDVDYVGAANEGEAIAIACGAELGGRHAVAFFQNSGLGNAVNPLTSLAETFRIPILLITTLRGDPAGPGDEPQHELMGRVTASMLELLEIPHEPFPRDAGSLAAALGRARASMRETGRPYALIVRKGAISAGPAPIASNGRAPGQEPCCTPPGPSFDPDEVLRTLRGCVGERDALVTTTGFTGRALYALGDRPNQLYMVGSMGCASSLGLGLARSLPQRRVVVVDGDGAALMRLGALATLGYERPPNLVHVLLDNGVHDSTGAQATVSPHIDFVALASACGYPRAQAVRDLDELARELETPLGALHFLHVRTLPRADRKLPRPQERPPDVARRFREWARTGAAGVAERGAS